MFSISKWLKPSPVAEALPDNIDPVTYFLDAVEVPFLQLVNVSRHLHDHPQDSLRFTAGLLSQLKKLSESCGIINLSDTLGALNLATQDNPALLHRQFSHLLLQLYQELSAIYDVLLDDKDSVNFNPQTHLRVWCLETSVEDLIELHEALDALRSQKETQHLCVDVIYLLQKTYHVCLFYELDTIADLSMALVDLFSRIKDGMASVDDTLLDITKTFLNNICIVLNAKHRGEGVDFQLSDVLLKRTRDYVFKVSQTDVPSSVEGVEMPSAFQKVLTPESVQNVLSSVREGYYFYILRVNVNQDESIAQQFVDWISQGTHGHAISSVTEYEGDRSVFDFLIASHLDKQQFHQAIAHLDPEGESVKLEIIIPPAPKLTSKIIHELSEESFAKRYGWEFNAESLNTQQLFELVNSDPLLSQLVLNTVNSAFYGRREKISCVDQAIHVLGVKQVFSLAFPFALHDVVDESNIRNFARHSSRIATLASRLAEKLDLDKEEAYLYGMLHDCGQLLMTQRFPDYAKILMSTGNHGCRMIDIVAFERKEFKTDHAFMGSLLAKAWNVPYHLCEAIAQHHNHELFKSTHKLPDKLLQLVAVSQMAEYIEYLCHPDISSGTDEVEWFSLASDIAEVFHLRDQDIHAVIMQQVTIMKKNQAA